MGSVSQSWFWPEPTPHEIKSRRKQFLRPGVWPLPREARQQQKAHWRGFGFLVSSQSLRDRSRRSPCVCYSRRPLLAADRHSTTAAGNCGRRRGAMPQLHSCKAAVVIGARRARGRRAGDIAASGIRLGAGARRPPRAHTLAIGGCAAATRPAPGRTAPTSSGPPPPRHSRPRHHRGEKTTTPFRPPPPPPPRGGGIIGRGGRSDLRARATRHEVPRETEVARLIRRCRCPCPFPLMSAEDVDISRRCRCPRRAPPPPDAAGRPYPCPVPCACRARAARRGRRAPPAPARERRSAPRGGPQRGRERESESERERRETRDERREKRGEGGWGGGRRG